MRRATHAPGDYWVTTVHINGRMESLQSGGKRSNLPEESQDGRTTGKLVRQDMYAADVWRQTLAAGESSRQRPVQTACVAGARTVCSQGSLPSMSPWSTGSRRTTSSDPRGCSPIAWMDVSTIKSTQQLEALHRDKIDVTLSRCGGDDSVSSSWPALKSFEECLDLLLPKSQYF